ncbi:MAG: hypothetical protein HY060_08765, partial [Proteobacteria bacterium]|nr:hypothetical protein [Pseudomonadota bacterium]
LDRLLEAGAVKFSNRPFTRVFTRHWAGEERTTLGMGNSVAQWDRYHRGLEFLYRRAVATGAPTPAQRADLERGLEQRRLYFLTAAFRSSFHAADFVAATELAQLLAVADVESLAPAVRVSVTLSFDRATRELARMFAAADLVLDTLDLLSELKGIAMFGFAAPDSVVTLIQRRRSDQRLELLTDVMDPRFRSEFLVLAADRMQREVLINLGFAPGRVIDFAQLLVAVSVLPPTPASPAG